jgi:hypothetical protein
MKQRQFLHLVLCLLLGIVVTHAQLVNGRFVTSFYTFERFDTVGTSATYLRAFQTVQLSVAQGDVSLHTYLQGAVNGTSAFGDNGRVRFYNLYLRWANIGKAVDVNLGRQAIYAGMGSGTIDGMSARARFLQNKIVLTAYGGSTIVPDYTGVRSDFHDNLHFGGQLVTTVLPGARLGLSYMNRRTLPDPYWAYRMVGQADSLHTMTGPTVSYIANEPTAEQLGSVDASYSSVERFSVYGRYDYDLNFKETARAQGGLRVNVTEALALTGDYIYRKPRISFNSIFSVFTVNSTSEVEGGLEYTFTPLVRAFAKVGTVSYTDTTSARWTLGVGLPYASVSYTGSNGYAGELTSFSIQAAYPILNRMVVPTLGVSYASYKLSADAPRDNALAVLLGAMVRPVKNFSFDLQGQWMKNRLYDRDVRLQVKLSYWFAERMSLFSQEVK